MSEKKGFSGRTTGVVGASRGLGRGIASAFTDAGASVVAVAWSGQALTELADTSANMRTEWATKPRNFGRHRNEP